MKKRDASVSASREMVSKDMRRDEERKKWETDEQQASTSVGPVHYQTAARNG